MIVKFKDYIWQAYLIRRTEEKLLELFRSGELFGTTHTCIGQEMSAVALGASLLHEDIVVSNHRCHGHYLAKTDDLEGLIAEIMGRSSGVCAGWGGSQHLCGENFFSNGIQGGIVPLALGFSFVKKIEKKEEIVSVCIGDGTFGEGVVYEALNIASKWELPLMFFVEDNGVSQSTMQTETLAGDISGRTLGFDIKYFKGNTWDWENLIDEVKKATYFIRCTGEPVVFHVETFRLEAHSKSDDNRDEKEIKRFFQKDPLSKIIEDSKYKKIHTLFREIDERIEKSVEKARKASFATIGKFNKEKDKKGKVPLLEVANENYNQGKAIYKALANELKTNSKAFLIGEDIKAPYGGAFKISGNLSDKFPDRVLNTPISEACIVGMSSGLAILGYSPIVEIMFGDFMSLAFDQLLNHAAKYQGMYNQKVKVPLIIRTPMGGGRGYGPTHSQCLEKYLVGVPGIDMFVFHGRTRVRKFYENLFSNTESPALVIENKLLYSKEMDELPEGYQLFETDEVYPNSILKPLEKPDITVIAFGRMSHLAEEAGKILYEKEEIILEFIFPLKISPVNDSFILESLEQTGRLLVIEEGTAGFDLAAEFITGIIEKQENRKVFSVKRLGAKKTVIPASGPMEQECLPSVDDIVNLAMELFVE